MSCKKAINNVHLQGNKHVLLSSMKLLQINTTVNSSSPGRIAEEIGALAVANGIESYIAYGRSIDGLDNVSASQLIKIGSKPEIWRHVVATRLFDKHGLGSDSATIDLSKKIDIIDPDVIHLHNIHGYYLNYPKLFKYLARIKKPVVWTLHDCWPFTGHCAFYTETDCRKWQTGCKNCPLSHNYPSSLLKDRSELNYLNKKEYFTLLDNLTLVTVSQWLSDELKKSFLGHCDVRVVHNGVDLETFRVKEFRLHSKIILGVANVWSDRKGLGDFIKLRQLLPDDYQLLLIGLSKGQIAKLPDGIIGVQKTTNKQDLANYYSLADVFVNPTSGDILPTTNIEAMACGTPVITYNSGGSAEVVDENTGRVVERGDVYGIFKAIKELEKLDLTSACRARAEQLFDREKCFAKYIDLYRELTLQSSLVVG